MSDNHLPPAASSCVSYNPGHRVHWIQARKSWEPDQPCIAVSVTVHADGIIDLHAKDLDITMWTHGHELERLGRRRGGVIAWALWLPRFHVLSVNGTLFNLATPEDCTECLRDDDDLPEHAGETAVERALRHARERGGFTVRASDLNQE